MRFYLMSLFPRRVNKGTLCLSKSFGQLVAFVISVNGETIILYRFRSDNGYETKKKKIEISWKSTIFSVS